MLHREAAIQIAIQSQHSLDLGNRRTPQRRRQSAIRKTSFPRFAMAVPPAAEGSFADPQQFRRLHLAQLRPFRPAKHIRETHPSYPLVNACPIHAKPPSWRLTKTGHFTSYKTRTNHELATLPADAPCLNTTPGRGCPGLRRGGKLRFSFVNLLRNTLGGAEWPEQWRSPEPKAAYDVVIVGAGGHGLATAYYLAKEHGIPNVAVLEKGWLGGGNTGRNTTIIRSNYLWDESAALYEHALKLWEGLSQELNYNVMYSPRGVMMLAHIDARRAGVQAPRPRQPPERHRQRVADARAGEGILPAAQHFGRRSAIPCSAPPCSAAAASRATMRSPGAMPAAPMRAASTSSRIAR